MSHSKQLRGCFALLNWFLIHSLVVMTMLMMRKTMDKARALMSLGGEWWIMKNKAQNLLGLHELLHDREEKNDDDGQSCYES